MIGSILPAAVHAAQSFTNRLDITLFPPGRGCFQMVWHSVISVRKPGAVYRSRRGRKRGEIREKEDRDLWAVPTQRKPCIAYSRSLVGITVRWAAP
jgi:hypothetical protein